MKITKVFAPVALIIFLLGTGPIAASAGPAFEPEPHSSPSRPAIELCAEIEDDEERLACFDAISEEDPTRKRATFLERHWDLRREGKPFRPWPHRPTYVLLARWTDNANEDPFDEAVEGTESESPDVQSVELKFQISFKTKLFERLFGGPGDLWFGYTQQSHFQIYNGSESRPFRETNYEPELMVTFPLRRTWGKWTWRMIGAGFVHQSNGRSDPLSRSWNRLYGIAAVERGDVSIHIRPWIRVDSDDPDDDDNPNIDDHVGRLETIVQWSPGKHALLFRGRTNLKFDGHKGSFDADWFFPIGRRVRGHVQVFTGYGESLIDYDHRQTTVGVGLLLFDPF